MGICFPSFSATPVAFIDAVPKFQWWGSVRCPCILLCSFGRGSSDRQGVGLLALGLWLKSLFAEEVPAMDWAPGMRCMLHMPEVRQHILGHLAFSETMRKVSTNHISPFGSLWPDFRANQGLRLIVLSKIWFGEA